MVHGSIQRTNPLLIPESPMQFCPMLGALVGESQAIVLQQLQYWLTRSKHVIDGEKWVFNTLDEWNLQFYWLSKSTLQRIFGKLRNFDYEGQMYHLVKVRNLTKGSPIKWYTINYDDLDALYPIIEQKSVLMKQRIYHNSTVLSCSSREGRILQQYPELSLVLRNTETEDSSNEAAESQIEALDGQSDHQQSQNGHLAKSKWPSVANPSVSGTSAKPDGQFDHQQSQNGHLAKSKWPSVENKGRKAVPPASTAESMVNLTISDGQSDHQSMVNLTIPTNIQETNIQENNNHQMPPPPPFSGNDVSADYQKAAAFYEATIDKLAPTEDSLLFQFVQTYGIKLVMHGITEMVRYNVKHIQYLGKVLASQSTKQMRTDIYSQQKGAPCYDGIRRPQGIRPQPGEPGFFTLTQFEKYGI